MPEYKVKRSHYTGKVFYKGGDPFPKKGDEMPAEPELKKKLDAGLIVEVSDETEAAPAEATEEEILAYLKGLEKAPEKKPTVAVVSEAMDKKATGKAIEAAWKAFTAE